jgi:ATP-dependent DNA helicase PIF1
MSQESEVPAPPPTISLSASQRRAFDAYLTGDNVFITGPGGTGKSFLINEIVKDAQENHKRVQVCALTGTAAVLLQCNAKTIHSWGGIGLGSGDPVALATRISKSKYKNANWKSVDLLIIDEVSMMSVKLFNLLNLTAQLCRKNTQPFGGIQVLFLGDFFQLPPVGSKEEPDTMLFCFESEDWDAVFTRENHIALTEMFRQTDERYIKILNQLRVGKITTSSCEVLRRCLGKQVAEDAEAAIVPTILYPTRRYVDDLNTRSLAALEGVSVTHTMTFAKQHELTLTEKQKMLILRATPQQVEYEKKYMTNNVNCDKTLNLKVGAQVMCVANILMNGICNGSRGVITKINPDTGVPTVAFKNGTTMAIGYHIWQSENVPSVAIKQIPLILAWAITIHKSQGASLEMAQIDIGNRIFECGQTYVALSRVKSLEGLYLTSFEPKRVMVHTKVKEFYESFE